MKKLFALLLLVGLVIPAQSQKMVQLDELKVKADPAFSMRINPYTNTLQVSIYESYLGEFREDPLKFVQKHFDVNRFIEENGRSKNELYEIYFKGKSGYIKTIYDGRGNLLSSYQEMKNVAITGVEQMELARNHQDWGVVNNSYVEVTKNGKLVKKYHKIKMNNGSKNKIVKLHLLQKERLAAVKN